MNLCDFYSYKIIGKLTVFLQFKEFNLSNLPVDIGQFHFRHTVFPSHLRAKIVNILGKESLRITLNIDGAPIVSRSNTHPSHSQTSRLLTSSLSLGVPVPHTTQCMSDV